MSPLDTLRRLLNSREKNIGGKSNDYSGGDTIGLSCTIYSMSATIRLILIRVEALPPSAGAKGFGSIRSLESSPQPIISCGLAIRLAD